MKRMTPHVQGIFESAVCVTVAGDQQAPVNVHAGPESARLHLVDGVEGLVEGALPAVGRDHGAVHVRVGRHVPVPQVDAEGVALADGVLGEVAVGAGGEQQAHEPLQVAALELLAPRVQAAVGQLKWRARLRPGMCEFAFVWR